jgi:histone demethylase JARID1
MLFSNSKVLFASRLIYMQRFHFRTRKQELNSVEGSTCHILRLHAIPHTLFPSDSISNVIKGTRANLTYLDQLAKFHKQHGTNLNRFPSVDKRPLDLYKLKKAVETRGGFEKVCKLKKWAEIGRDLGYSGKIMSSLSTSLKNSYQRWLFTYAEYLRLAKPGVHQQLEFEYGGPLTPSPAPSPMKKSHQHTPSGLRGESPAIRASDALNASIRGEPHDLKNIPMLDAPAPPPAPPPAVTSGFTPVNIGGFTPVNASPATFTSVNINSHRREREPERSYTPPRRMNESPMSSSKNTPEYRPSALSAAPMTNGYTSNPLKRQLSHDSIDSRKDSSTARDDSEGGGRRSKRLKKGMDSNVLSTRDISLSAL